MNERWRMLFSSVLPAFGMLPEPGRCAGNAAALLAERAFRAVSRIRLRDFQCLLTC